VELPRFDFSAACPDVELGNISGFQRGGWKIGHSDNAACSRDGGRETPRMSCWAVFFATSKHLSALMPLRPAAILLSLGSQAASAAPCTVSRQRYSLVADEVTWSMRVESGHRCTHGVRYYNIELGQLKLISPPSSGEVSLPGWGFTYLPKEGFLGSDQFVVGSPGTSKSKSEAQRLESSFPSFKPTTVPREDARSPLGK
jgi:hypothetical protein